MTIELRNAMLTAGAIVVLAPALAGATEPQVELRRNPFERPAIEELIASAAALNEGLAVGRDPGLRAVLVAGSKSVVDLGGVILQIGESTNGYQLLSVEEGIAIFSRNDEKIVISLYEQENSEER